MGGLGKRIGGGVGQRGLGREGGAERIGLDRGGGLDGGLGRGDWTGKGGGERGLDREGGGGDWTEGFGQMWGWKGGFDWGGGEGTGQRGWLGREDWMF